MVIGRSNIVGVPVAHLLLAENATVTVCHSRTSDIAAVVREVGAAVNEIYSPLRILALSLGTGRPIL